MSIYLDEIIYAAEDGLAEQVCTLLDQDPSRISKTDERGSTPLHVAAYEGHTRCVQLLLDRGADSKAKSKDRYTALMYAAQNGKVEVVALLLERFPDFDDSPKDKYGRDVYEIAKQNPSKCTELLEGTRSLGACLKLGAG